MTRRSKPPNRYGCKPDEDVCVAHDLPLECKHGCLEVSPHICAVPGVDIWREPPRRTRAARKEKAGE